MAAAMALFIGVFALPAAAYVDTGGFEAEVVRLVNEERAKAGRPALNYGNAALNAAAMKRAREYAAEPGLRHTRPGEKRFSTVFAEYGIEWRVSGENIASGQRSPALVVEAWMDSASHRMNIMGESADFNWIGVAVFRNANDRLYWVQLFVKTDALEADVISAPGFLPGSGATLANDIAGLFTASLRLFAATWNAVAGRIA